MTAYFIIAADASHREEMLTKSLKAPQWSPTPHNSLPNITSLENYLGFGTTADERMLSSWPISAY